MLVNIKWYIKDYTFVCIYKIQEYVLIAQFLILITQNIFTHISIHDW